MFKVIRSSAGAGKTHALVKHYLVLCLRTGNASAYRQVLALTFTNKAAGEMRDRAVEYLRKLAARDTSEGRMRDVMDALVQQAGADEAEIGQRADATLRHMLHHFGDVAISTIDAFTRRVGRPFARDLRLDQALRMTTDADWYRDRAVDSLIAEAGIDLEVTRLLVEACDQLLDDEQKWDPAVPLRLLIGELDKERSIEPLKALSQLDAQTATLLRTKLLDGMKAAQESIRTAGRSAVAVLDGVGVPDEAWAQGAKGIPTYLRRIAAFDGTWVKEGKLALKAMEKDQLHSNKADADAKARIAASAHDLRERFAAAHEALATDQRRYFLLRAMRRELPTAFALHELNRHLEQIKHDDGVAFFSDLTRRVAEVVRNEPAPWILERVGERYLHFLLDEFQDTSLLQWQCLLPLIDNALAKGGSAFIVGDAKQAIYRWRNGEAQLLTGFPQLHAGSHSEHDRGYEASLRRHYVEGERLVTNRRSARAIIEFNNSLFDALPAMLPEHLRKAYDQQQQQAQGDAQGLVRIRVLPAELKGADALEAQERFLLEAVQAALADGFKPGDIAVLVRGGTVGKRCVEWLKHAGHAVSSPDGGKLISSDGAQAIIDLLRVIHARDECAAARALQRMHRLQAPAGARQVNPFPVSQKGIVMERIDAWLREHGRPTLRTTITALLERLSFALGLDPALDGQLLALLDEAHGFGLEHGQDIAAFIEHWDRKGGERSADAGASPDAVQVLTIHKAKGLEFPVVIVPATQMRSGKPKGERLWIDARELLPELPLALISDGSPMHEAGVPELVEEEQLRLLDDINLLYVAFTRPKQRLLACARTDKADPVTKQLISWLEPQLQGEWFTSGSASPPWQEQLAPSAEVLRASTHTTPRDLPLRFEAPESWDLSDPDPLRRYGILVHDALSRVAIADDLPTALGAMLREGTIDQAERESLHARLEPLLLSDALAPWFAPGLRVRNEASIITANGHALRPDRIVLDGKAARVLDIKTGAASPSHHDQVRGYMQLLTELGHAPVEGALLYTRDGRVEIVHPR